MWPFKKWAHFKLVLLCCSLVHLANKPVLGEEVQGRVVTPRACVGWEKESAGTSVMAREVLFFECNHTHQPSAAGYLLELGPWDRSGTVERAAALVARHSQGTALVQLRAQLYRETWESPREIVHFCCCCCLHQNMRSLWPSVLSIKSLLVCAVSYDTNTVKV